ncbi:single-stranded-DNA-specific exonuclease RecJ [Lacrimispora algidixylanolytica]|uniref:Single-stranded-DNA-specific exonuclease RecJ n=1 Tax=Lacrimispora algidixylanolytica TaxID=94868 RepID=A0A419T6Q5_9FIRM|nr:single-stranded-DNA-specific exonuclease RecJ [Lacrimispora algidixylanolytica]RKD33116.1 single-stranded-DNA-specific exonuclease RecJ [Lacrimispora algidixylanolytica]
MAAEKWMLQTKRADFEELAKYHGISPVTARIIRNRDVVGMESMDKYLNGGLKDLYSPYFLKDMKLTVTILMEKIREKKRIRIVGDYDIDGVCSTYLLYRALNEIGAYADYEIPDRIKDGYGINESIIRQAAKDGIDTILTCDNGIAATTQIALAKELGLTVLITDHHDIRKEDGVEVLPPADAIINPKQMDCSYPYPEICGGLVAYKLVQALYEAYSIPQEKWLEMIEFAAIATVGDVMKLQDENRIIVKVGLKRMGQTKSLGLKKLIEKNNLDPDAITGYQIGFVIGPCLNAGGRLHTAKLALSLLLSESEEEADRMAQELKDLNDQRKTMTKQGTEKAIEQVESLHQNDKVLVVYLPDCHESLAGIIAGRLREQYQKPSFVLTDGEEGVKGSGRSIEAYHMFDALVEVKDLLVKFGGHPMAAGLSLERENVEPLRNRLNELAKLGEDDFVRKIWIDVPMPLDYIDEPLIEELDLLEPFGQGNEKPLFAQKGLSIRSVRVLGKNRNVVKFSLASGQGMPMDALLFANGDSFLEELLDSRKLDVIYYPTVNEYNGNKSLQIVIKNYKILKES